MSMFLIQQMKSRVTFGSSVFFQEIKILTGSVSQEMSDI